MKIGIDAQLTVGTATGIGEYIRGLVPALRDERLDVTALRAPGLDPWRFDRRVLWDQVLLPLAARDFDVLHCAAGTVPLAYRGRIVVTVHDIAWLRVQQHNRFYARYYFGEFALAQYRRANRIIVDSIFSRDELLSLGDIDRGRVSAVYPGVSDDFAQITRVLPAPDDEAVILCVGTVEQRKNLEVVIAAMPALRAALRGRVRLICAGPPTPYQAQCLHMAREHGVAGLIEFRGYVPRAALLELYATATLAVVPSKYEGFGYGAAQALCAGVPLVVARAASLPEVVAGSNAVVVDPDDPTEWAKAIFAMIEDAAASQQRAEADKANAAASFSWARCGRETAAIFNRMR